MVKMSDAFELPIHYDSGNDCLIERDGTPCGQLCTDTLQEHAANAINCHDELVAALEAMVVQFDAEECVDFTNEADYRAVSMAKAALEKAK